MLTPLALHQPWSHVGYFGPSGGNFGDIPQICTQPPLQIIWGLRLGLQGSSVAHKFIQMNMGMVDFNNKTQLHTFLLPSNPPTDEKA